jgi:beta-phosphoglucomutase-like phosphatase (HAD superfamily)
VKTALVTSGMSWKVEEVSRQLALGGLFDVIVTAADIERGKPDPACYLAATAKPTTNRARRLARHSAGNRGFT